jgi:lipopolysaccharide biosynthesis protein
MNITSAGKRPHIAVFIHLFYTEQYASFRKLLNDLDVYSPDYFFNIGKGEDNRELISRIYSDFPDSVILESPNIGKDIGGKLALLELYMTRKLKSDYMVFIHDKASPQLLEGDKWRNQLLKILSGKTISQIIERFECNPEVGLIGTLEHISDEFDPGSNRFKTTNEQILKTYISEFGFELNEFPFLAGNMFWIRSSIYEHFFGAHSPLELRAGLESGNVTDSESGTKTHSLERIFSWIALDQKFKIHGI